MVRGEKAAVENERDSLAENMVSLTQEQEEYARANSELSQQVEVLCREK